MSLTKSNKTVAIPKGQSILSSLNSAASSQIMVVVWEFATNVPVLKFPATKNLLNGAANQEPTQLLKICVNSKPNQIL